MFLSSVYVLVAFVTHNHQVTYPLITNVLIGLMMNV